MATELVVPRHRWSRAALIFDRWLLDDGDWARKGSPVCTLDVNGVSLPVAAEQAGFLTITAAKVRPGQELQSGTVLGYVTRPYEAVPIVANPVTTPLLPLPTLVRPQSTQLRRSWQPAPRERAVTPRARRTAREMGVPLRAVRGTGYRGRVTMRDVASAAPAILASGGGALPGWCGVEIDASYGSDASQFRAWAHDLAAQLLRRVSEQDLVECSPWEASALQLVATGRAKGMTTFHEIAESGLGKLVAEEDVRTNMVPVYLATSPTTTVFMPPLPHGGLLAIGISAATKRPVVKYGSVVAGTTATLTVVFDTERLRAAYVETWLAGFKLT
ncbi:MAG: E3 binding domain-containing protein [Pirellulaceae bacterium]